MTCLCKNPKPALMRGRDRKYTVVCMNCTRTGYKAARLRHSFTGSWQPSRRSGPLPIKSSPTLPRLESQTTLFCTKPSTMRRDNT